MTRSRPALIFILIVSCIVLSGCRSKQDGAIEGTIVPPGKSARITAIRDGKEILTVSAGEQNGKFRLALAAGTYSLNATVADSPYPLHVNDIEVRPGETTVLPPIEITTPLGTGSLSGKTIPPRPDAEVKLIYEGKERAAVHTDREGKYEFKELPAGSYVVQVKAPGHTDDIVPIMISDNQKAEQNAVLLPLVHIDGVDWTAGKIRASGIGMPPHNVANDSVRREMAKRAALADAQRNMLRTIEQVRIDAVQNIKAAMRKKSVASKIQGFIKGYTVVSEHELEGGKIEVILELPLTGSAGLSRYVTE